DDLQRTATERAEQARHKLAADRARIRAESAGLIEKLRREGGALLEELKATTKSQRDLSRFVAEAQTELEQIAPAPPPPAQPAEQEPLKVGDEVELGQIRGELLVLEAGKAVIARGGMRIEVAPDRLRRAAQQPATRAPKVSVTTA